jgi:DNA-binding NtrC family response regulator
MKVKARKAVDKNGDTQAAPLAAEVKLRKLIQLANTIEREVDTLRLNMLIPPFSIKNKFDFTKGIDLAHEVRGLEVALITHALLCTHGNQAAAAKLLGLKYTTLNQKLKHFDISPVKLKARLWKR